MVVLACLLAGPGCIKIDATLTLARDGSGTLRAVYAMPGFLIKQMDLTRQWTRALEAAEGSPDSVPLQPLEIPMVFDEPVLNGKFAAMAPDGVSLVSLKTRDQGGWKYVDFTVKFTRLQALFSQPCFRDCAVSLERAADESVKLSIVPPPCGGSSGTGDLGAPEALVKLTPFLNGLRVVVRIDCPGDIRNSTSLVSDQRRATWEWDFDKDIRVLDRLSREKMAVVFDGTAVRMPAFEKPAGDRPGPASR